MIEPARTRVVELALAAPDPAGREQFRAEAYSPAIEAALAEARDIYQDLGATRWLERLDERAGIVA